MSQSKPLAVVTRRVYADAIEILNPVAEVVSCPEGRDRLEDADLVRALDRARALVCQLTDPVGAQLMDAAPELAVIANVAVGYDNIDVAAATERGIVVTNTPGVLTEATADLTLALILAQARRMVEAGPLRPRGTVGRVGDRPALRPRPRGKHARHRGLWPHRPGCGEARARVRNGDRLLEPFAGRG